MNQKDIEQGLRRAFAQSTPDLTDAILSECGERRGEIVTMKRNTSEWSENGTATARRARPGKFARIVAAAAALLLVVSGAFVGTIAVRNAQADKAAASGSITVEEAKEIVLNDAGLRAEETVFETVKQKDVNGAASFELHFSANNVEYDYAVNAKNGTILSKASSRVIEENVPVTTATPVQPTAVPATVASVAELTMDEAKAIALKHAGVTADKAVFTEQQREFENGKPVYEFDFYADGVEYDYEIDAVTGEVRKAEREIKTVQSTPQPGANELTMDEAKAIAVKHAGVTADKAVFTEQKREYEDGRLVYEFDFHADGVEYDYEIDAVTGEVRKAEWEKKTAGGTAQTPKPNQNTKPTAKPTDKTSSYIGASKAKSIALNHAGVSSGAARGLSCELDRENGRTVYEVDFKANGYEYDYEIDAVSGKILKHERDRDD